eukprot:COSAG03_NODE_6446_length_1059_cov_1.156250_2_plen_83_part_00
MLCLASESSTDPGSRRLAWAHSQRRALEHILLPSRPASSTIVVNKHAQFKPHKDSGAGAGQHVSMIAGLGEYSGGELVVEGR